MYNESIYNAIRQAIQIYGGPPYVFQLLDQAGKEEITYLMSGKEELSYEQREVCSIELLTRIKRCIRLNGEEKVGIFMYLKRRPLYKYVYNFSSLLRVYIEEEILERDALYNFGINLATENRYDQLVKLGLIILGNFENDFTKKVIKTLGYHSEFTLYAIEAISRFEKSNKLIGEFVYDTDGYGKLAAVIKYKPVSKENQDFLLDCAMEFNSHVKFDLAYVVFERMLMLKYFEDYSFNEKSFSRLSFLIAMSGSQVNLKKLKAFDKVVDKYLFSAYSRNSTYMDFAALLMIKKSLRESVELEKPELWPKIRVEQMIKTCETIIARMDYKKLIMSELIMTRLEIDEIGLMISVIDELYNTNGHLVSTRIFDMIFELAPFLYDLIDYFIIKHPEEYIKHILEYVKENLPSEVLNGKKEVQDAKLKYLPDVWVVYILKTLAIQEIYDEEFILNCLNARFKDVRVEAARFLRNTKYRWSKDVEPALKKAFETEPSLEIAEYLRMVIYPNESQKQTPTLKQEYVTVDNDQEISSDDIELIETFITGNQYRDLSKVMNPIYNGDILLLYRERDNAHDERAIMVCTVDGYVVGYVAKKDNKIPSKLMDEGEFIYAVFDDEDIRKHYPKIRLMLKK